MEKITCSLEDWDSVIDYFRPNGSSKSWYIKELKKLSRPLMWGDWNIYSEDGDMFNTDMFKGIITPNYCDNLEYTSINEVHGPHLYLINVYSYSFFVENFDIGFNCISKRYIEDLKNGLSKIVILFLYEGYSGSKGNLDLEIIEKWRKDMDLPIDSIYYISGNLIIDQITKNKGLGFQSRSVHCFETWNKYDSDSIIRFNPIDQKYLFLSYNRNPRRQRIILLLDLLEKNLFDKGLISLNNLQYEPPENCNIDHFNFLKDNAPFSFDHRYDLYYNLACNITKEDYERTFISLVSESLVDEDTLFLSEKLWKPIMVGHPFIVYGNKGTLEYIKNLGYKTFDKWINEDYDNQNDMNVRSKMVCHEIEKFSKKNIDELFSIREEMNEICIHNQINYKKLYSSKYGDTDKNKDLCDILKEIWTQLKK